MELTKQERLLLNKIRAVKEDMLPSVVTVKYTPLGETGHIQTILYGSLMPITSLRKPLVSLLKDIKKIHKKGYAVFASYDNEIGSLNVFEMKSLKDTKKIDKELP